MEVANPFEPQSPRVAVCLCRVRVPLPRRQTAFVAITVRVIAPGLVSSPITG